MMGCAHGRWAADTCIRTKIRTYAPVPNTPLPPPHTHPGPSRRALVPLLFLLPVQILYYDGQFNDARLNVALACTAAAAGGTVANYVDVRALIKVGD